jgi:hypothetical protein
LTFWVGVPAFDFLFSRDMMYGVLSSI